MIEEAIKGIESTVPVTSLNAYNFLSAGTSSLVWPITATWISFTCLKNSFGVKEVLKLGMDSNLSMVPPVWPSPRPDIFAIVKPQEATKGANTNVVLSPTPPVECLSTVTPWIEDKSFTSPLSNIAFVK